MLREGAHLGGRFALEEAIGTGSMGTVFRARETGSERVVAIKVLKSTAPEDALRFDRELRIVQELRHPAIVECWEGGTTAEGDRWLAMEWLDGETLRERLRRAELTLEESLTLAVRLLGGLAYAHEHGIVHRDVKPANVFLVGADVREAKLVDFGIARQVEEGETLTRAGEIVGTPGYVSPEQVRGERVDARSDVYSVGCVLFRCLTGRAVFEEDNALDVLFRVTRERAPAVGELRPDLPVALATVVDRMLEREPIDRPADAASVLDELEGFNGPAAGPHLASKPSHSTSRDAARSVTAAPARRFQWAVGSTLVAAAIAFGVWRWTTVEKNRTDASVPTAVETAPTSLPSEASIGAGAQPAWGSIRIGSRTAALRRLNERVHAGTATASERLWLALLSPPGDDAKRNQREAATRSGELTPFEQSVLDAAAPLLASPPDFRAANDALGAVATSSGSAELWMVLARLRVQMNDKDGAYAAVGEAKRGDWAVAALVEHMWVDRELFDFAAAKSSALGCVQARPDAVDCIAYLSRRAALDGDCTKMEGYARDWVGTDPDDPSAYEMVAFALAAHGATDGAILEALEQKWARLPERDRSATRQKDLTNFESLRGRFDKAVEHARASLDGMSADTPLLKRLVASFTLLLVSSEMADMKAVHDISARVLDRASGSTPPTPSEAAYFLLFVAAAEQTDTDPRFAAIKKSAFDRYHEFIASQGSFLRPYQRNMPWIVGYAAGAHDDERLKEAYEALPRYGTLPPPGYATDDIDLVIGKVLAANGERERGLAYLERASRSCLILENPYAVVRSHKALGEIREQYGDAAGAKEAYGRVLAVWGDAVPTSRTASFAKERLRGLR